MSEYFTLSSYALIGAVTGSLANSMKKKHQTMQLIATRAVESALIGYAIHWAITKTPYIPSGSILDGVATGSLTFLVWNNAVTRPYIDMLDSYESSLLGSIMGGI